MFTLVRTGPSNEGFKKLVNLLDAELAERDGKDHAFYDQFNKIDQLKYVVLVSDDGIFSGCGAFKPVGGGIVEIKRMFVLKSKRGKGIASMILEELEKWSSELGFEKCCLETGKKQPEAMALYKKRGYKIVPNYGPYKGVENSVCFEKHC